MKLASTISMLIVVAIGAACALRPHIEYSLRAAKGACSVVNFPEWQFPERKFNDGLGGIKFPIDFGVLMFRLAANTSSTILVAADGDSGNGTWLTSNKYRMQLDNPAQLSLASEEDWNRATPLNLKDHHDFNVADDPRYPSGRYDPEPDTDIVYRGRVYRKTGKYWAGRGYREAVASIDGAWIMLQSYDGPLPSGKGFLQGGEPTEGPFYIDVFRASDGQPAFQIRGRLHHVEATYFYDSNGWALNHYMVLQLDSHRRSIVVCDPQKAH